LLGLAAGILLHIFYAAAWHGDTALLPDAFAAVNFVEGGKISKEYLRYIFDFQLNLGDNVVFYMQNFTAESSFRLGLQLLSVGRACCVPLRAKLHRRYIPDILSA
jgi:hypothetical protein